jgi:hypothetical protein
VARTVDLAGSAMTECPLCGSDILTEITTMGEAAPTYLCPRGHRVSAPYPALPMALVPYGPEVPTPEDILRGAGLDGYF